MAKHALPPHYGSGVSGDYFWPRPDIVDPLVASLVEGQSHKMFGLRRIGKSSIMLETKRLLVQRQVAVAHVDVQDLNGLHNLLRELLRSMPDQTFRTTLLSSLETARRVSHGVVSAVRGALGGELATAAPDDEANVLAYWGALSEHVTDALQSYGRPVVLLIDEFPFLCENLLQRPDGRDMLVKLLASLRQWRSLPNVAMLVTGSIGMRGIVYRHGLNSAHLNDMMLVQVPPLSEPEAHAMLAALAGHSQIEWWTEAISDAVLRNIPAAYPSFIQYAFTSVRARRAATLDAVQSVFANDIVPGLSQDFFVQFRSRLRRYDVAQRPALEGAIDIVVHAEATGGIGIDAFYAAFDTAFTDQDAEDILEMLIEDGFLLSDIANMQIHVASPLVSIWAASRPRRKRRAV